MNGHHALLRETRLGTYPADRDWLRGAELPWYVTGLESHGRVVAVHLYTGDAPAVDDGCSHLFDGERSPVKVHEFCDGFRFGQCAGCYDTIIAMTKSTLGRTLIWLQ